MEPDEQTKEQTRIIHPAETKTEGNPQADPRVILDELDKSTESGGMDDAATAEQCPSTVNRPETADDLISEVMTKLDEILEEFRVSTDKHVP